MAEVSMTFEEMEERGLHYSEAYPSLREAEEFLNNIPETCLHGDSFQTISINQGQVFGGCSHTYRNSGGCQRLYTATFKEVNEFTKMINKKEESFSPEGEATYDGKEVYWKGKKVVSWKAKPDPYNPSVPRLHLKFTADRSTNLTGHDSSMVWTMLKKKDIDRRAKNTEYDVSGAMSGRVKSGRVNKVKDPEFEKVKGWDTPGKLISISRKGEGSEIFLIKGLDNTLQRVVLQLVRDNKTVKGAVFTFTAEELSSCTTGPIKGTPEEGLSEPQLLDHGPKVYCQSQYE